MPLSLMIETIKYFTLFRNRNAELPQTNIEGKKKERVILFSINVLMTAY